MTIKSESTITTTGKVRSLLAEALSKAASGNLSAVDGKNMIGLANQITSSMTAEIKHQAMEQALGIQATTFGNVNIGSNDKTEEK